MAIRLPSIEILRDSREKDGQGWFFEPEEKQAGKVQIVGTVTQGLSEGDYSIVGYEDILRIERKRGFAELFGNFTPKEHKLRFEREMERLRPIKHKYLLIETNLSHDTLSLGVPQQSFGPPCNAIMKWLHEIEIEYGIHVNFVGECGKRMARSIFEQIVRKYHDRRS